MIQETAQYDGGIKNIALSPREESKMEYLVRVRKALLTNIDLIDRAIELLEKNPEFAELNDLLRRI